MHLLTVVTQYGARGKTMPDVSAVEIGDSDAISDHRKLVHIISVVTKLSSGNLIF